MTHFPSDSSSSKRFASDFIAGMHQEKNARMANDALRDLMLLNNALEAEIQSMKNAALRGVSLDMAMFEKMNVVKDKYNYAMSGLKAFDDEMERYAMISLADAIQDLMFYLHHKKGH